MSKEIIYVDASALKQANCLRRYKWACIDGWSKKGDKKHKILYGSAGHKALEAFYSGRKTKPQAVLEAVELYAPYTEGIPSDDFRTKYHLGTTLISYFKHYEGETFKVMKDSNDTPFVEQRFAYPIYNGEKFDVILCGTIDLLVEQHGQPVIIDHKFTSARYPQEFFRGFSLDIQTRLYSWYCYKLGITEIIPPVIINAIFIKPPTQKAINNNDWDGCRFERSSPLRFSSEQLLFFEQWLKAKVDSIVKAMEAGDAEDRYDLSSCHEGIFLCKYIDACKEPPHLQKHMLSADFEKMPYNPLTFGDL